jgi:hypothetical protein
LGNNFVQRLVALVMILAAFWRAAIAHDIFCKTFAERHLRSLLSYRSHNSKFHNHKANRHLGSKAD